jgi:hypothetical protein
LRRNLKQSGTISSSNRFHIAAREPELPQKCPVLSLKTWYVEGKLFSVPSLLSGWYQFNFVRAGA